MPTKAQWREAVLQLDDWKDCAEFMDDSLISLWEGEDHMSLKTLPKMLNMCKTSKWMREKLFGNSLVWNGTAESLQYHQQQQLHSSMSTSVATKKNSSTSQAVQDTPRPKTDFPLGKSVWSDKGL